MDYTIIARKDISKRTREDWGALIAKLGKENAVSIVCPNYHILRLNQFCLYRAAKRMGKDIMTSMSVQDEKLTLTVWLNYIHRVSP